MSLAPGYSRETVNANIALMMREGYPRAQAVAASTENARKCYFKRYPSGFLPPHLKLPNGKRDRASWNNYRKSNPCGCEGRAPNPVPESSRSKRHNRDARIAAASRIYTEFTGHDASEVIEIDKPDFPDTLAVIGDIDGILYTTVRDGITEKYIHKFKKNCRPLFCVSPDGKQLFMLGGSYDFTERGIVDRS